MPSPEKDIEFLQAYQKKLQELYQILSELSYPQDFTPVPEDEVPVISPDAKLVARLADYNGFDGSLFRDLTGDIDPDPTSASSMRHLRKKFQTIPRIIAKIEKSHEKEQKISLTDNELQLLYDMANKKNECRHRSEIHATTSIAESTLKTILKDFEKKGWINRPKGPRSGYTITVEGLKIYEAISAN